MSFLVHVQTRQASVRKWTSEMLASSDFWMYLSKNCVKKYKIKRQKARTIYFNYDGPTYGQREGRGRNIEFPHQKKNGTQRYLG